MMMVLKEGGIFAKKNKMISGDPKMISGGP